MEIGHQITFLKYHHSLDGKETVQTISTNLAILMTIHNYILNTYIGNLTILMFLYSVDLNIIYTVKPYAKEILITGLTEMFIAFLTILDILIINNSVIKQTPYGHQLLSAAI